MSPLRPVLVALCLALGLASGALAQGILPNGRTQFVDGNGAPFAGGQVFFYIPNTTTAKTTWSDSGLSIPNSNPVVLDSAGRAQIWGAGCYSELLQDQFGVAVWNQVTCAGNVSWGGTSGGSANSQTISIPGVTSLAAGQAFQFKAGFTNTTATSLTVSGLSPVTVDKDTASGPVALVGGEIVAGNLVSVTYDGAVFHLTSSQAATATLSMVGQVRGFIAGFETGAAGGTQVLTIGPGAANDNGNSVSLVVGTTYTKSLVSWTVGSGNGCLDTGNVAANTAYFLYVIERPDSGVVDYACSLSNSAPTVGGNIPAAFTVKRGPMSWVKTDSSSNVLQFQQRNNTWLFGTRFADVNNQGLPSTATLYTLTVPLGFQVEALMTGYITNSASSLQAIITSPDETDQAPGIGNADFATNGAAFNATLNLVRRTNTLGQIRARSSVGGASTNFYLFTYGFVWTRGANS